MLTHSLLLWESQISATPSITTSCLHNYPASGSLTSVGVVGSLVSVWLCCLETCAYCTSLGIWNFGTRLLVTVAELGFCTLEAVCVGWNIAAGQLCFQGEHWNVPIPRLLGKVWEWDEKWNQWVSTGTENNLLSTFIIFPQNFIRWRRTIGSKILVDIEHVHVFELYYLWSLVLCTSCVRQHKNVMARTILWIIVLLTALMWQLTDSWERRTLLLASYMHGLCASPSKLVNPCSVMWHNLEAV